MPRILPLGGEVVWPKEEGTLGVVGVAPWATIEFCKAFYSQCRAEKDWHFPRVLLDINTKIPSRGRHLDLNERNPSEFISETIKELAEQGATLAIVACNTAHILYEQWSKHAPIPILHIIEETIRFAVERGAGRVAALVSSSLSKYDLYAKQADALGVPCYRLESDLQKVVSGLIESIKTSGGIQNQKELDFLWLRLRALDVDTVVAGCTELSILEPSCMNAGMKFVDSNYALARAALRGIGISPFQRP
jgi:aspartate racemase